MYKCTYVNYKRIRNIKITSRHFQTSAISLTHLLRERGLYAWTLCNKKNVNLLICKICSFVNLDICKIRNCFYIDYFATCVLFT